jgi:hypothetical protein
MAQYHTWASAFDCSQNPDAFVFRGILGLFAAGSPPAFFGFWHPMMMTYWEIGFWFASVAAAVIAAMVLVRNRLLVSWVVCPLTVLALSSLSWYSLACYRDLKVAALRVHMNECTTLDPQPLAEDVPFAFRRKGGCDRPSTRRYRRAAPVASR